MNAKNVLNKILGLLSSEEVLFTDARTADGTILQSPTFDLGEDVEVDGYKDNTIVMIIATINVLGKPYYDELLKQGAILPSEISTFLERKFLILERDRKIDSIISDGLHDK